MDGDVNEGTHNVTAEVRIRDVINPFDVSIYRELAGGTTVANVLHGSANAIGGQNQIVKWRWGGGPDELLFVGAPEGIKFALGENPKQSNWRNPHAALSEDAHGRRRADPRARSRRRATTGAARRSTARPPAVKGANPIPPEPDLQLEAIAEILEGKRKIHCHSYRKDEILQMLRSAEEFGVQVATLQHVLEGYKVADEIAAARRGRLRLLGLVGLQGRGLRRDPLRVPADARARRDRLVQLGLRRARAAPEHRGRQGRQVRRRRRRPTRWRS